MKLILSLLVALALVALAIIGLAQSGWYDVSATTSHSGPVRWLLSTTSEASIERRAAEIDVPDLSDDSLILAGAGDYDSMCADCHGAPGRDPGPVGRGLNPEPPDLADEAGHMTPAELFWVTKNGIRMTGMPAWGVTHDDGALWAVVAFMTELPHLDAAAYQSLLTRGAGMGHHAADQDSSQTHGDEGSDRVPAGHEDHDHSH